ncbi:MAG: hypothetical protein GXO90_03940 [FCB group bacterium]|nr:hypothetical protein [FCB group bacterium]
MLPYIRHLSDQGYHLVAFDSRNHGSSDPDQFSSVLKFAEDIEAVIEWLTPNPKVNSQAIGLVGFRSAAQPHCMPHRKIHRYRRWLRWALLPTPLR